MHHHYLVKTVIILILVLGLNFFLKVSFLLPIPRSERRMSIWLLAAVSFVETHGWTLIVAMIVAAVWQIAERL